MVMTVLRIYLPRSHTSLWHVSHHRLVAYYCTCITITKMDSPVCLYDWTTVVLFNYVPFYWSDFRCGLVALWMAAHLVTPVTTISMENIMQMAVNKGYTAQGEMFSGIQSVITVRKEPLSVQNQHKSVFLCLNAKLHSYDAYEVCVRDTDTVLTAICLLILMDVTLLSKVLQKHNSPKRKKWKRNNLVWSTGSAQVFTCMINAKTD